MSHDHDHKLPIPDHYEGDFDFTNGKFAMWLFLVSDAMAFIGFLGAYMVLRMGTVITNDPNAIAWRPDWSPPLDLILTGLNTFVLIISSVTMVKALAAFQEGKQALGKTFLLATIAGGSFFVGFQVWEWNHLIHEGVTMSGIQVPTLDTAMERAEKNGSKRTRLEMAQHLFGTPELPKDFDTKDFEEAEFLALGFPVMNAAQEDHRPLRPGVIHLASFGIPAIYTGKDANGNDQVRVTVTSQELYDERRQAEPAERGKKMEEQRARGARVSNNFAASFFVLTGFHGLHVLIGVIYLWVVFFRARAGAYGPGRSSPVEVAGLYWHFVDLVWVLLFMLIYLI
jgi:cytochrome c oxidase subunit 3